jgi:hypothetical protein
VRRAQWAWLLAAALLLAGRAEAHNPETSYARVAIGHEQIELRLTFDLFTLQKIAAVDADGDQRITRAELQRAAPAVEGFLRAHVRLELDGEPASLGEGSGAVWPRDAGDAIPAKDWHSAEALIAFPFRKALAQPAREVDLAFDVFETFGVRHTVLGAFEYAGRSEEVTFTQPEPDYLFDTAYAEPGKSIAPAPAMRPSLRASLARFFKLGIEHIFLGYDHICFLLALLVMSRFRELVKIVTSFTVAHSITLILASLSIARLPSRLVECAIAATIVYVAAENLWRRSMSHRWLLTFGFGLIHGFGFAGVLAELGLPAAGKVRCLLAFNAGVEVGQLAIVTAAFPLVLLLGRWRHARLGRIAISVLVGLFGLCWLIERAFALGFMPF